MRHPLTPDTTIKPKPWSAWLALCLAAASSLPASAGISTPPPSSCTASVDVLFLFDTTGSMGATLVDVQAAATNIMNNVLATLPTTRFGVADYKDYPASYTYPGYSAAYGGPGDYPWKLDAPMGTPPAGVQTIINTLSAAGGGDTPEAMTRALSDSGANAAVGWQGSSRIIVLFTDAPPHDLNFGGNNFGGDPGTDAIAADADDLDFEAVVAGLGAQVVSVDVSGGVAATIAALQYAATQTGGTYGTIGADFAQDVTNLILGAVVNAGAEAFNLNAEIHHPAPPSTVLIQKYNKQTAPLDHQNSVVPLTVITLGPTIFDSGLLHSEAQSTASDSSALARVEGLNFKTGLGNLGTIVTANVVQAASHTVTSPAPAKSDSAGTSLAGLLVLGTPVNVVPAPNTVYQAPGVTVIVNEQEPLSSGGSSSLRVNFIHVYLDLPNGDTLDVIISSAFTNCGDLDAAGPTRPVCPPNILDQNAQAGSVFFKGLLGLNCLPCEVSAIVDFNGANPGATTANAGSSCLPCQSVTSSTFGYTCTGIPFRFTDISATGTALNLGDDQLSVAISIGFSFKMFGTSHTNAYVSSNGYLTFDAAAGSGCCSGQSLPDATAPNDLVAGYWEDLYPPGGGSIKYQTLGTAPLRSLVVQWTDVPHYGSASAPATFQVVLFEGSNAIEVRLDRVLSDGGNHVTGIENAAGIDASVYRYGSYSVFHQAARFSA
ncbi:MAG: vWA domain-containing protein [bacterium]